MLWGNNSDEIPVCPSAVPVLLVLVPSVAVTYTVISVPGARAADTTIIQPVVTQEVGVGSPVESFFLYVTVY